MITFRGPKIFALGPVVACLLFAAAGQAEAHHSFAMFDSTKTVDVKGTVEEWEWTNPHTWVKLKVPGPTGPAVTWTIEGMSPNILSRRGWSAASLKPGDKVTISLHPLKTGTAGGSIVQITLSNGTVVGRPPAAG